MTGADYLRYFPYDVPYDHQREAMGTIADAIAAGSDVLFEGATGTGKTLAALAPALDFARETGRTVVITTNVHQQMRQFRREASAIAETEPIRAVMFRGKGSMCHIDVGYRECQALRETTRDLVDAEGELVELEQQQRDLLAAGQEGDGEAMAARSAIMDELESVEAEIADVEQQSTCDHYYRNLTTDTSSFFAWLYDDVRTPDDIYRYADDSGWCGYELLKEGVEGVDLVVCNYHHLLDPTIREQFFRWLGRDPEDIVTIFDEAHNVERTARDHARRTLTETTLSSALDELVDVDDARAVRAENVVSAFLTGLQEAYRGAFDFGEREQVGEDWHDLSIDNDDRRDDLTLAFLEAYTGAGIDGDLDAALELGRDLDRRYEREYKNGERDVRTECQTLQAATFVADWLDDSASTGTYPVVSVRRGDPSTGPQHSGGAAGTGAGGEPGAIGDRSAGGPGGKGGPGGRGDIYGRAELYTCIPEQVTRSLFDDVHSTVLMSATLRPFEVTEAVLGLEDPTTMAYGAQFPEENRRTYAVDGPALFASKRDDASVVETITDTLEEMVEFTPGNTLLFFPSYSEAERYHEQVTAETKYLDRPGTPAHDLREEFTADDDGVMFTSLWGTLGEGVSYDGGDARSVAVVGVPYPHLDDRLEAVQEAYDAAFGDDAVGHRSGARGSGPTTGRRSDVDVGWHYAVEVPTVRKTRQALGRVIRSPEDFGVRVLLDARYTQRAEIEMSDYAVRGTFPPEERAEFIDVEPEKLKYGLLNFFTDRDAWDGDPPTPD